MVDKLLYNEAFYARSTIWSIAAAKVLCPLLMSLVKPTSVIDVGCGEGAWLQIFEELGVSRVKGIDGDYVNRDKLLIAATNFLPHDLNLPLVLSERYDLAICLEVAEHLPKSAAETLVQSLVALAPIVVFSAAVPGQGGTGHINEQPHDYWHKLFAKHNYQMADTIRPHIKTDTRIEPWYRNNCFWYESKETII